MTRNLELNRSLKFSSVVATVLVLLMVNVGHASFITDGTSNTRTGFDSELTVSDNGRRISISGTVDCTQGEKVQIHVSITQSSTGAVAEGNWKGECTGSLQTWGTDAVALGNAEFEPGAAQGVGLGVTTRRGKSTDAIQWLNEIILVQQ